MSNLDKEYFHNEAKAIKYLEHIIWYDGICCPHCCNTNKIYSLEGKSTRAGLKKCGSCKKQFTVKVGTVFESSHIPLHKWLQAAYLISSSKKGISSHQLHRTLQITYKSAWFMMHRLREAMKANDIEPMGGIDKMIEIDEAYIGGYEAGKPGGSGKMIILGILDRTNKKVLTKVIPNKKWISIAPLILKNVIKGSVVNTDELGTYKGLWSAGYRHKFVNHTQGEYVRNRHHTNGIEGYFGIFKRGMKGIYQHCSESHLGRYLTEFDFRYNHKDISDIERFNKLLTGICGKRLTYK